ncbi:hypothetical protein BDW75DRAFT_21215 [Aspergillus navahoensis]
MENDQTWSILIVPLLYFRQGLINLRNKAQDRLTPVSISPYLGRRRIRILLTHRECTASSQPPETPTWLEGGFLAKTRLFRVQAFPRAQCPTKRWVYHGTA